MMVRLKTNLGIIDIELDDLKVPNTVDNFLYYVQQRHYDGSLFHRVIPGFMIQCGGFQSGLQPIPNSHPPILNESSQAASNQRGTLAMARTDDPHSATSQFFINLVDNTFLDYQPKQPKQLGYCVFGKVSSGMDVVDKIAATSTATRLDHQDVPTQDIMIEKAFVLARAE